MIIIIFVNFLRNTKANLYFIIEVEHTNLVLETGHIF